MKKIISALCLSFVFAANNFAQDDITVNNNQSLLYTNPSFAGSNGGMRVQSVQGGAYPNYYFVGSQNSVDAYLKNLNAGLALSYANIGYRDEYSKYVTQNLSLTYAQYINVGSLKIVPSFQVSLLEYSLRYSSLFYEVNKNIIPIVPAEPPPHFSKKDNIDFNSGILLQCKNFYGGVSVFHINKPDIGLGYAQKLPILLNVHASYNFIISEKTLIQVAGKFSNQYQNFLKLNVNAVLFKHFIFGLNSINIVGYAGVLAGYRGNYFSATMGCNASLDNFNSYYIGDGMLELALSYNLRNKDNRKKLTAFEAW